MTKIDRWQEYTLTVKTDDKQSDLQLPGVVEIVFIFRIVFLYLCGENWSKLLENSSSDWKIEINSVFFALVSLTVPATGKN